jgi:hypothetical protein
MDGAGARGFAKVSPMKVASVMAGIVLAAVLIPVTAIATGSLAVFGARFGGMRVSQPGNFDPVPLDFLVFGGLAGAILFGPMAVGFYFLFDKKRGAHPIWAMLGSAMATSLLAFPVGFTCYKNSKIAEVRKNEEVWLFAERQKALDAQSNDGRNAGAGDRR